MRPSLQYFVQVYKDVGHYTPPPRLATYFSMQRPLILFNQKGYYTRKSIQGAQSPHALQYSRAAAL